MDKRHYAIEGNDGQWQVGTYASEQHVLDGMPIAVTSFANHDDAVSALLLVKGETVLLQARIAELEAFKQRFDDAKAELLEATKALENEPSDKNTHRFYAAKNTCMDLFWK